MFAFLFKEKPVNPEYDAEMEMAKLALADRIDVMMAKDTHRRLRFATLADKRH
jgi:hypothetical protein